MHPPQSMERNDAVSNFIGNVPYKFTIVSPSAYAIEMKHNSMQTTTVTTIIVIKSSL